MLHSFSATDWLDRDDGDTLTFEPAGLPSALLIAKIDNAPDGERVHLAHGQVAFLAVALTRAVGLVPPIELENLARERPGAPAEVTTMSDPREVLLERAMHALWETPNSVAAENSRLRVAVDIARHLLSARPESAP